jgi:rare lipoprotein A
MFKILTIKKLIPLLVLLLLNNFVFAQKTQQQLEKEIATLKQQIEAKKKEIEKSKANEKKLTEKKPTVATTKKELVLKKANKQSNAVKVKPLTIEKEIADTDNNNEVKKAGKIYTGTASYYSAKFEGRKTANGEIFKHSGFTAACNQLPLGTWLKITNLQNGKTVVVKTNDRMHPKMNRLVDLTLAAAKKLGFVDQGLAKVKAEVIKHK